MSAMTPLYDIALDQETLKLYAISGADQATLICTADNLDQAQWLADSLRAHHLPATRMLTLTPTESVLEEIKQERAAQNRKWGEQNHIDGTGNKVAIAVGELLKALCQANEGERDTWMNILSEEVGEAFSETSPWELQRELIQVGAVAAAWIEAIDRRT